MQSRVNQARRNSRKASPTADKFASLISEYLRERITPGAPAVSAAVTASHCENYVPLRARPSANSKAFAIAGHKKLSAT